MKNRVLFLVLAFPFGVLLIPTSWSQEKGTHQPVDDSKRAAVSCAAPLPNGHHLYDIQVSRDGSKIGVMTRGVVKGDREFFHYQVRERESGKVLHESKLETGTKPEALFSPDLKLLAVASSEGVSRIEVANPKSVTRIETGNSPVGIIQYFSTGELLVERDGHYQVLSKNEFNKLPLKPITYLTSVSANGRFVLEEGDALTVVDTIKGAKIQEFHGRPPVGHTISNDGELLAERDNGFSIWNVRTGDLVWLDKTDVPGELAKLDLAFSADNKTLLLTGTRKTQTPLRNGSYWQPFEVSWDLATRQPLRERLLELESEATKKKVPIPFSLSHLVRQPSPGCLYEIVPYSPPAVAVGAQEISANLKKMASASAAEAYEAIRFFEANPLEATKSIPGELVPDPTPVGEKAMAEFMKEIAELGNDDFGLREAAEKRIREKLKTPEAWWYRIPWREAVRSNPDNEIRARARSMPLNDDFRDFPEVMRKQYRLLQTLERIRTKETKEILQEYLKRGKAGSPNFLEAKKALARMEN